MLLLSLKVLYTLICSNLPISCNNPINSDNFCSSSFCRIIYLFSISSFNSNLQIWYFSIWSLFFWFLIFFILNFLSVYRVETILIFVLFLFGIGHTAKICSKIMSLLVFVEFGFEDSHSQSDTCVLIFYRLCIPLPV